MQKKLVAFILIYLFSMISSVTDDYCTTQIQNLLQSLEANEFLIWQYGLISIVVQLILPLITTLLIIWYLFSDQEQLLTFFKKHFEQLFIENLRCWGFVLFSGLFLIFPAFIVYFFYCLVPFVVVLSPRYAKGEIDALKYSRQIVFKIPIQLLFSCLLTIIILPLINAALFSEYNSFVSSPTTAAPLHFIEVGIQFLTVYLFGKLFLKSENLLNGEPHATTHV